MTKVQTRLLQMMYPNSITCIPRAEKTIYLTFDDGPVPYITEFVLSTLQKYNIKATFFCVGHNVVKHHHLFKSLVEAGHSIGNHTFNHMSAFKNSRKQYFENIDLCEQVLKMHGYENCILFRPPYGQLWPCYTGDIMKKYKIVLWDVLSYDFLPYLLPEKCLKNTIRQSVNGSVVVFHDNIKAYTNLEHTLPRYIEHMLEKGYQFASI